MATDMFMIYQINDAEKNREYRCRSYAYQIEHGFMITTDNSNSSRKEAGKIKNPMQCRVVVP